MTYDRRKEIQEAIFAGEIALDSLKEAQKDLKNASLLGWIDILGDNFLSGLLKHKNIRTASAKVDKAKRELARFRDELSDIRDIDEIRIEIGGFMEVADLVFDNMFLDIYVQSRISEFRNQLDQAIDKVQDILFVLKRQL